MATALSSQQRTDTESRNEFHRVIALQSECVTDALRELLEYKLATSKVSLEKYLQNCRIHLTGKPHVTKPQQAMLVSTNPNTKDMDLTMLTMLLLAKCNKLIDITKKEKLLIEKLRDHRNAIAHNTTGRLNDNTLFTETSNDIISLSRSLKVNTQSNLKACIDELKQRVCVRVHSKLEVMRFNQEQLRVVLIHEEDNGKEQSDPCKEALLKFNLTKWAKQIARGLELPKILQSLRQEKVISTDIVDKVNEVENECDKSMELLEYLVRDGSKIQILQFCKHLRLQCAIGERLADLIENRNTEGRETVEQIKRFEEDKIKEVLQENLEIDENGTVACEEVHSYIEEILGYDVDFSLVNEIVFGVFGCTEKDLRYDGISFKHNANENMAEEIDIEEVNVGAMAFQSYAEYVGNQFRSIDLSVSTKITSAILEEAIQVETFVAMTEEDLKDVFSHYLEPAGYKFGIRKHLQLLQSKIKNQIQSGIEKVEGTLRQFDTPIQKHYQKKEVSYSIGDTPGIPAHEFVQPQSSKLTRHLIVKNTVRFIAACLNSRKNGTIHFGIKRTGRNKGKIIGINFSDPSILTFIDEIIERGIKRCFGHLSRNLRSSIIRCTRPAQVIAIHDQPRVVVEIDVVPFSRHLGDSFFTTLFPPNGPQQAIFFVYERNDIVSIEREREDDVKLELEKAIAERQTLDSEKLRDFRCATDLVQRLTDELTRGADYITDIFYPIICVGKVTTEHVLDNDGLQDAFQNSVAVFDFGSSTELRKKMEDGIPLFTVKTVADFDVDETLVTFSDKDKPWIYCNGNDDLGIEAMDADSWTDQRMIPLENVLRCLKKKIPLHHAKVIFLVFEKASTNEPMVEFAREAFIRSFKHQCLIIGERIEDLEAYENEITRKIGNEKVNNSFFSGLSWFDVCKVFRKTFKENSNDVCKLPNSSGTYEELSQKEKGKWKDIEILSMDECVYEEKSMNPEELKNKLKEEETKFYQGKKASWWNFYYRHHGERDLFSKLRNLIDKKLSGTDGKVLVESVEVRHEPGAGGSILGRHLIWHFSQSSCTSKPYRCCVVKQITENTVKEIEKFREYKDVKPRPVIILLDDEPDGNMYFQKGLHQLAYKTASPGELFGIVINITRVSLANEPIEEGQNGKIIVKNTLKHRLTDRERQWFEKKYKELEDADVDVNTLIAFNVMRNSFEKEYIKSTVGTIMEDLSRKELDVLKILSLFGTYEIGVSVPSSVFDAVIGFNYPVHVVEKSKYDKVGVGKPYGMRERKLAKFTQPPEILNSHCISLFACRAGYELRNRGLRVISQPLAEVILGYIREKQNLSLEDIVMFVLEYAKIHTSMENSESRRFIEVVCSLFKIREDTGKRKDGGKDKFSRLIFAFLDKTNEQTLADGRESVVRVMEKCFIITEDAFVGQQLARFYIIHKKDFEEGENAISDSIDLCPNNSYLLDTYGQVFKTKMEYIKETNCQRGSKMPTDKANEVIPLAFEAMDKFIEGQAVTQEYEKDKFNLSCYYMEVRTLVGLLEMFELFECYTNEDDLVNVLTKQKDVDSSFLSELNENGLIDELVSGGRKQLHAADVLRFVEERDYQVKKIYTIYTEGDVLLLNLRERFERFYRSHGLKYQLKFGYGLKPLMLAYDSDEEVVKDLVEKRFFDAERNIQHEERMKSMENADVRDLLFFLGFKFIEILRSGKIDAKLYRRLLNYSTQLLATQREEHVKRPYLEAYLFFSIFHWPRKNRFEFKSLSSPNTYNQIVEEWEHAFQRNNYLENREQLKINKGKNYFALSKDSFGVIDLYEIELEWRKKKEAEEGRSRMHVYKDYFWREPFVANRIKRLTGTLDDAGCIIRHCVKYPKGNHMFKVRTFYPSEQLRNRQVTFVLGFTWSGLRAFDVLEAPEEIHSSGEEEKLPDVSETNRTVRPRDVDYTLYQRNKNVNHSSEQIIHVRGLLVSTAKKGSTEEKVSTKKKVSTEEKVSTKKKASTEEKVSTKKKVSTKEKVSTEENVSTKKKVSTEKKQFLKGSQDSKRDHEKTQKPKEEHVLKQSHDQTLDASPKDIPKSTRRQFSGYKTGKPQKTEPEYSGCLEDYPSLENVASEASSNNSKHKMDYAGVLRNHTRQGNEAYGSQTAPSNPEFAKKDGSFFGPRQVGEKLSEPQADRENPPKSSTDLDSQYWEDLLKGAMDFLSPQDDLRNQGNITGDTDTGLRTGLMAPGNIKPAISHTAISQPQSELGRSTNQTTARNTARAKEKQTKRNSEFSKQDFDELD